MDGKFLTIEDIRGAEDLAQEEVAVPEWKGTVIVRALTALERDQYEQSCVELKMKRGNEIRKSRTEGARARLVIRSVIDPATGKNMFTDADEAWLNKKSGAALDRIWDVAARLSGITDEDFEELVGNSDGGQSDGSISGSPNSSENHPSTDSSQESPALS